MCILEAQKSNLKEEFMRTDSTNEIVVLNENEIEQVSGAFLANIGMGVVGAAAWMGAYAMSGWSSGLSGSGFLGAAAGGFVHGAGGFNAVSASAGAATSGAVVYLTSTDDE